MNKIPIIIRYFFWIFLAFLFVFSTNNVAWALRLRAQPWQMNADGEWITQIEVVDRTDFVPLHASAGEEAVLPLWVLNHSAMRVLLAKPTTVVITARSIRKPHQFAKIVLPSPQKLYPNQLIWNGLAVGPHLVNIGWGWLGNANAINGYQLYRKESGVQTFTTTVVDTGWKGWWEKAKLYFSHLRHDVKNISAPEYKLIATLPPKAKTFSDNTVQPSTKYEYRIVMIMNDESKQTSASKLITTPQAFKVTTIKKLAGKGMILLFDTDPGSNLYFKKLDPHIVIGKIKTLGLHYVELRTVYGAFSHFTNAPLLRWLNEFLDQAAANNIDVISWSIPRRETSTSVAADVTLAAYTTPKGNTFAGVALDLELGAGYMEKNPQAKQHIAKYAEQFRSAAGKNYLLAAMVYSPTSGYTNAQYPYQELAKHADVLQPMEFWHFYYASSHHVYTKQEVFSAIDRSIKMTQTLAGKQIPINVIGQLTDLGGTGKPSGFEIDMALAAAKTHGALGLSFFDWHNQLFHPNGTLSPQAAAIQQFQW